MQSCCSDQKKKHKWEVEEEAGASGVIQQGLSEVSIMGLDEIIRFSSRMQTESTIGGIFLPLCCVPIKQNAVCLAACPGCHSAFTL